MIFVLTITGDVLLAALTSMTLNNLEPQK